MKHIKHILFSAVISCLSNFSFAQTINWKSLEPSQKHIVNLNAGLDYAATVGVGYGYHLHSKLPIVLNLEYSMPFGNKAFDDLKTKIGGQVNLVHVNNFYTIVKAYGIIRRYENDFARMVDFGSEFSANAGIYKSKWFAAADVGFDKAITTHIKHSDLMKQYNPDVQSGWYIPTGGNFFYGLLAGYSLKRNDVYAKVGRTISQDFTTSPMVPYYFQVGWSAKF